MQRTQKIKILSSIILIGFSISVLYSYVFGGYLHLNFPFNTFLMPADSPFTDFTNYIKCNSIQSFNPYINNEYFPNTKSTCQIGYLPFGALINCLFALFASKKLALLFFLTLFIVGWIFFVYKNFKLDNKLDNLNSFFTITFLSYPFLFAIDRGNLELYMFLLLSCFCFFCTSRKRNLSNLALLCLSLAIAIKPFPVLLMILLIDKKKWKEILVVIALVLLICILSLFCFKGGLLQNIQSLRSNQILILHATTNPPSGLNYGWNIGWGYGHSLFGALKVFLAYFLTTFHIDNVKAWIDSLLRFNSILSFFIFIFVTWYTLTIEKVFWKKLFLLIFVMLVTSPISGDYRLLSLFIPLAFFVNEPQESKYDLLYVVLFGLMMIPKSYYIIPFMNQLAGLGLSLGVVVNPLLLFAMAFMIIREGFLKQKLIS